MSERGSAQGRPGRVSRPMATVVVPVLVAVLSASGTAASGAGDPCAGIPRAPFDDVGDASTPAVAVDCLVWHGIAEGVTYERFGTGDSLRRDQLASLFDRAILTAGVQLPDPAEPPFTDVRGVHADAIGRLAKAGIVEGRTVDSFEPLADVRRDQLAAMVVRAYDAIADEPAAEAEHEFTDLDGNVHSDAIARAVALDLVTGVTATTYEGRPASTRGQTAMVIARLLQRLSADGLFEPSRPPAGSYDARIGPLPDHLESQVRRSTWRSGCPVDPSELALAEVVFVDFEGVERWGMLVVHAEHAEDVTRAFGDLYDRDFPIARIEPIERYGGDDDASMAANNTSAFNCRFVSGTSRFSEHAYGWAIDINPIQNPHVRGNTVLPSEGQAYLDRDDVRPGMLVRPGAVEAFDDIGWGWGGDWNTLKDYQHVSLTGR